MAVAAVQAQKKPQGFDMLETCGLDTLVGAAGFEPATSTV
jgi:hypothetical protein